MSSRNFLSYTCLPPPNIFLSRSPRSFWAGLKPASEAGVKLMVESDRWWSESPLAAEFWVAGRQFADGREVYVCVGTDAAASVVETAFKIVHASFA